MQSNSYPYLLPIPRDGFHQCVALLLQRQQFRVDFAHPLRKIHIIRLLCLYTHIRAGG